MESAAASVRPRPSTSVAVVPVAVLLLALATWLFEGPREMNDLEVFHRAGIRFVAGEPLYRASDGHFEFKYLPGAAAAFAPLALLPLEIAKVFWIILSSTALGVAFALARPGRWWVSLAAFVVLARSMERELAHGQVNGLVLLFVVAAFVALAQAREREAGAFLALAILFKPHWLLALPYLLAARRWRAASALGAGLAMGLLLPVLRYGVSGTLSLHATMNERLAASTARLLTYPTNISLAGALAKLTGAASIALPLAMLAVVYIVFAVRVWRDRARPLDDLAVLAPLALLASPQAWDYTIVTALPAIILVARELPQMKLPARVITVVLAAFVALDFVVLLGRDSPSFAAVMRASPGTWFLCWSALLALQRTRVKRTTSPSAS